MKIILGSKSQSRRVVLERMGYDFDVMSADIDEKIFRHDDPKILTMKLAEAKAEVLLDKIIEPSILITSDQVVVCDGDIREKPESESEARQFLKSYSVHPAETVTAVVVINTQNHKRASGVDVAKVYLKPIPNDVIDGLIREKNVFRWAGGYAVEDQIISQYVIRIEGEKESMTGLPKALTERLINEVK